MGKTPKKKKLSEAGSRNSLSSSMNNRSSSRNGRCSGEQSPESAVDKDDAVFIGLAVELKEEGTRLFQRRDYERAAFKFDKAIQLLPKGHDDIAFVHCNIAACYMHMNPEEYHRAIDECNSALEASPKYTKALLKRARCFEALDKLDLACRDVQKVLSLEPNNVTALELSESIREVMEETDKQVVSPEEPAANFAKEKIQRRVSRKFRNSIVEEEVWEMIHDKEDHENDQDDGKENCSKENHTRNDLSKEENDTGEMQVKHNQDKHEKHTEEIKIKKGQYKRGARDDEEQQRQHTSWDMEEMNLKQRQEQGKSEKHLKEILVKGIQLELGRYTKQNQVISHSKQEKHTEEKYERYTNVNQERHSLERHIGRCNDMLENRTTIKTTNHGRDKHEKHTRENHEDVSEGTTKNVKFILGDDIRIVLIPENCSLLQLMDIARYKYNPYLKSFLLKFMDKEGDLVTITSTEDLRWVEELNPHVPVRLYIKEVSPDREIIRDVVMPTSSFAVQERNHYSISECGSSRKGDEKNSCVDDWMMQFARLFKNHAGFDSDACVDLRDLGIRLYYEAMEDTITSEEAQEIFQAAEAKFQEMAALALFNWGNVHMTRARKRLFLSEDASKESILSQLKDAYEWACTEYVKAGKKFEDSVDVKPDFYEGLIALGQQQFEQAKLSWRYADTCKVDMGTEVLELFNHAEDNMEKGMEMWEGIEYLRVKGLSKSRKEKIVLDKLGLNEQGKDLSTDEAFEQASNMRSQLNISWGTILYERSVVEFKLGLSSWEESLQEAIEKFKTGGASLADISVMVKNHCVNENTQEGLSFNIDEIVQAWNEMYDAKKLKNGSSSFRLEPLFRRRSSKLHNILEHIHYT
ncbi:HSP-interacting protein-like [Phragmites australis]|uniref:HSP-interacting protein-like n=1 Tax=Phragmites australis TaxID=29695 RepID=UPI002D778702|nr:HSP-interacting protein-like [Phragmites australis]